MSRSDLPCPPRARLLTRLAILGTVTALAAGALGCGDSSDDGSGDGAQSVTAAASGSTPPGPGAALLGVLTAGAGTYADDTLTLEDVDPRAVWFTDRPGRQAGTDGVDGFLKLFFAGQDPPNAAIRVSGGSDGQGLAVAELSRPSYDAEAGELTFRATLVSRDEDAIKTAGRVAAHPALTNAVSRQDGELPRSFDDVTVFVDAAPAAAETPDEQRIAELAQEQERIRTELEGEMLKLRVILERNPKSCVEPYLDEILQLYFDVANTEPPRISKLQSDTVANGGTIPASDQQLYSTVKRNLDNAAQSFGDIVYELKRQCDV